MQGDRDEQIEILVSQQVIAHTTGGRAMQ